MPPNEPDDITIAQWRAVVRLMDSKIADAQTNSHILPSELEAWKLIRAKAQQEVAALLLLAREAA